jgi:hypothetical protein
MKATKTMKLMKAKGRVRGWLATKAMTTMKAMKAAA